jgi:hypothetical protein
MLALADRKFLSWSTVASPDAPAWAVGSHVS